MYGKILCDQRGFGVTTFSLFLIFLSLICILSTSDFSKTVHEYDVNLQTGVAEAVRNAAFMVEKESLARGKPIINHEQAHKAFNKILEKRVMTGEIKNYVFVVYNHGYGDEGKIYYYKNGELEDSEGYPCFEESRTFYISPDNINITSGEVSTTLKEPGCIALVELKTKSFLKNESESGYRWAASEIIISKDFY